ncbi:hypothetical protein ZWY2020_000032 [Hordeum vulgare]|nr:hypothetical protein ZWY2020_000032 [Hordeum vulgare]
MVLPVPPSIPIPDELLEEIFLRLPSLDMLACASATCTSFCRVIKGRPFRRRFRELHRPPLLGFMDAAGFQPAQAPHTSAPLAGTLGPCVADFSFIPAVASSSSYVPLDKEGLAGAHVMPAAAVSSSIDLLQARVINSGVTLQKACNVPSRTLVSHDCYLNQLFDPLVADGMTLKAFQRSAYMLKPRKEFRRYSPDDYAKGKNPVAGGSRLSRMRSMDDEDEDDDDDESDDPEQFVVSRRKKLVSKRGRGAKM